MAVELGLRERKKLRTRQHIADTARKLFSEHGFNAVPVVAIAREADVSEATVFNYFPTKEDLVFQDIEAYESELLAAVRNRPIGETIVVAFGRFLLQPRPDSLLAGKTEDVAHDFDVKSRIIADSPALLSREREILAHYADLLAELIAEDTLGDESEDLQPFVVARSLIGVHQTLIEFGRRRLRCEPNEHAHIALEVQSQGRRTLSLLEKGLEGYGAKRPRSEIAATSPDELP